VSFIFLRTCVNDIPCKASARSEEAESRQARYQDNGFERCGPSHPAPSRFGSHRLKALAGSPFPSFGIPPLSFFPQRRRGFPSHLLQRFGSWWRRRLVQSVERHRGSEEEAAVRGEGLLWRFTHLCLGSVYTNSKQVDTSPRFQKTQLPEMGQQVDTSLGQVDTSSGSTLDPVSSRLVCRNGTAGRHWFRAGRHTPAESQKREFFCTRGWLRFRGFDLGFRAHAPQSTLWTYGAINTHVPCTPKAREPIHFLKNLFGG
ncbi:hypothetical protein Taro_004603, partial [Colocasia esculenta]|nr:hypothetical protein [Colocasia esculenta]